MPLEEYQAIRKSSVKNPDADALTLGKYTTDASSYTVRAGSSSYFDLGDEWGKIQDKYQLPDTEMFDYFNNPALDDAIASGKTIRFSHDPRPLKKGFLVDEWEHIKSTLHITDHDLIYEGGFWYVK